MNLKSRPFHFLPLLAACTLTSQLHAALMIPDNDAVVTSFAGWDGTLPSDFVVSGATNSIAYRGTTANTTGGTYSITGFEHQASSSANSLTLTGTYENGTGFTVGAIDISYDAFVEVARASRTPGWSVSITTSTGLTTTVLTDLDWSSANGTTSLSTSFDLTDVGGNDFSLTPGATFAVSFFTDRGTGTGSSPMIGLDNVSVQLVPEPSAALLGGLGFIALLRRRR